MKCAVYGGERNLASPSFNNRFRKLKYAVNVGAQSRGNAIVLPSNSMSHG
jgi:hypothetical protein